MNRLTANLLTVLAAATVLLAGALFSSYVIPAATEDGDGLLTTCEVEINTPQEIIQSPPIPAGPQDYFPWSFANRTKVGEETPLEEPVMRLQRSFLSRLRDYIDVLYGLKVDSLIMEKHTGTWQALADAYLENDDERYGFFADLLFTDASGALWRISAAGYSEEIWYVSCYQESSVLTAPLNPVKSVQNRQLIPMERYDSLAANYPKYYSAFNRLRGKLYSLETMYPTELNKSFYTIEEMLLADPEDPVVWSMEGWLNGRHLLSAISTDSFTPVCYVFLDFQKETDSKSDYLSEIYADYHGYTPWPSAEGKLAQADSQKKGMVKNG